MEKKRLAEEIIQLEKALRDDPQSASFHLLADAYTRVGKPETAITVAKSGLGHHPDSLNGWVALGRAFFATGNLPKAAKTLKHALSLPAVGSEAYRLLAEVYLAQDKHQDVIELLASADNRGITDKSFSQILARASKGPTSAHDEATIMSTVRTAPNAPSLAVSGFIDNQDATNAGGLPVTKKTGPHDVITSAKDQDLFPASTTLETLSTSSSQNLDERLTQLESSNTNIVSVGNAILNKINLQAAMPKGKETQPGFLRHEDLAAPGNSSAEPHADWESINDQWRTELDTRSPDEDKLSEHDGSAPLNNDQSISAILPPLTDPLVEAMPPMPSDLEDNSVVSLSARTISSPEANSPVALEEIPEKKSRDDETIKDSPSAKRREGIAVDLQKTDDQKLAQDVLKEIDSTENSIPISDARRPMTLPGIGEPFSPSRGLPLISEGPHPAFSPELSATDRARSTEQLPKAVDGKTGKHKTNHLFRFFVLFLAIGMAGSAAFFGWFLLKTKLDSRQVMLLVGKARSQFLPDKMQEAIVQISSLRDKNIQDPQLLSEEEFLRTLLWLFYGSGEAPTVSAKYSPWTHVLAQAVVAIGTDQTAHAKEILELGEPQKKYQLAFRELLVAYVDWQEGHIANVKNHLHAAKQADAKLALLPIVEGDFLREQGDLEGAEKAYREALSLVPAHPLANFGLCRTIFERHGFSPEAAHLLNETTSPTMPVLKTWWMLLTAEKEIRTGALNFETAKRLEQTVQNMPKRPTLLLASIRPLLLYNMVDEAANALHQLKRYRSFKNPALIALEAQLSLAQGLEEVAQRQLQSLAPDPRAALLRNQALLRLRRPQDIKITTAVFSTDSSPKEKEILDAWTSLQQGKKEAVEQLTKLASDNPLAQFALADYFLGENALGKARPWAQSLLAVPGYGNFGQLLLARLALIQNDLTTAMDLATKLLEKNKQFWPAAQLLGHVYLIGGRVSLALPLLAQAYQHGRMDLDLLEDLIIANAKMGNIDEAKLILEQSHDQEFSSSKKQQLAAYINLAEGDPDLMEALSKEDEKNLSLLLALGKFYEDLKQPADAFPFWKKALKLDPSHPLPQLRVAMHGLTSKSKNRFDPLMHFQATVAAMNNRAYFPPRWLADAHYYLGQLSSKNDTKRASQEYNEFLKLEPASPRADQVRKLLEKLP